MTFWTCGHLLKVTWNCDWCILISLVCFECQKMDVETKQASVEKKWACEGRKDQQLGPPCLFVTLSLCALVSSLHSLVLPPLHPLWTPATQAGAKWACLSQTDCYDQSNCPHVIKKPRELRQFPACFSEIFQKSSTETCFSRIFFT